LRERLKEPVGKEEHGLLGLEVAEKADVVARFLQ